MIGKPEWFTYRIFGWGLRPRTWQGWVYVGAFVALVMTLMYLPLPQQTKLWSVGILIALLLIDTLHIMAQLKRVHDERQNQHQLIIERNASFAAVFAIVAIMLYQAFMAGTTEGMPFDYSLLIVLLVMVGAKIISTAYLYYKK